MTKHTKGPWRISTLNCPEEGYVSIDGVGHTALALVVWQMDDDKHLGINSPTCEANAHLIKASPKLLEALEYVLAVCPAVDEIGEEARIEASAAIAEAKGEL